MRLWMPVGSDIECHWCRRSKVIYPSRRMKALGLGAARVSKRQLIRGWSDASILMLVLKGQGCEGWSWRQNGWAPGNIKALKSPELPNSEIRKLGNLKSTSSLNTISHFVRLCSKRLHWKQFSLRESLLLRP